MLGMGGKKILKFSLIAIPLTVLMLALFTGVIPVSASNVVCGATITSNTILDENLSCGASSGIVIGADGIMVDLNGFTISGTPSSTNFGVDNTGGFDRVTIRDGTISGFGQGIRAAAGVTDFKIKDVTLTGDSGPGGDAHKIDIRGGKGVTITGVTITVGAGSPAFAEAIRLESIDNVIISNVLVHGGFVGVNFACKDTPGFDCLGLEPPTNGVVKDSTFLHNFNAILIAHSVDTDIANNVMMDGACLEIFGGFCALVGGVSGSKGINIDFLSNSGTRIFDNEIVNMGFGIRTQAASHSNLKIESNYIHDNLSDGMFLEDVSTSRIFNNIVTNNVGKGIFLDSGSTGNKKPNQLGNTTFFQMIIQMNMNFGTEWVNAITAQFLKLKKWHLRKFICEECFRVFPAYVKNDRMEAICPYCPEDEEEN